MLLLIGLNINAQQKIQLRSTDKAECVKSDMTSLKASFSFSTIEAEDYSSDRGTFSWLSLPNTVLNGNVGEPQIPVVNELISVPFGAQPRIEITSYSSTDYNLADYGIKTLVPRQRPVRKSENPDDEPFIINEAAYQSTRGLRSEPHAVVSVEGTMRGVQLGMMTIEPVSYDPVNNKIRVFNDIEVTVHFDEADVQATEDMLLKTYSPAFDAVYSQLFNNRAVTDVYTDHPDLYNTPVRMLVICYSGFQGNTALNSWLQWKLQKGYYVDIFYTDETGTTANSIKNFIKTKYNASVSAGNAYTYLVVIGDTDQVPYYMVKYIDDDIKYCASDLGYAAVNFTTSSTSNYFPDMYYSRISVENATHLTNYINKVLTYEKYEFADGGNYLNNVILVGGWDSNWTNRVAKPTINYATNNYFNSSNTTYGGFSGGTIHATISTSSTQGWSGTNHGCYNGLNDGVCFLNYTAHGDKQEWQGPQFTANQVETVTNTGKYFFGVGNCCLTGNYNLNDANYSASYAPSSSIGATASFGETMIRVPNAGAIAYVGCSPYSYWYEDFYWAVGAHSYSAGNAPSVSGSTKGVYDVMFQDQYWNSASALLYLGNLAVQQAVTNGNTTSGISGSGLGGDCNNSAHYYFQFYHTFGDGSIMPYITKPEQNTVSTPSAISPSTTSITVNALAGSYVAVTDNSSVIYGVAEANSSGVATVNFTNAIPNSGTLYVVVTRQQYQPYFGTIEVVGSGTQYNITTTVNPTGAGTVEGAGQYYENTQCTLTATANHGYAFDNWTLNNVEVSNSPTYTFTVTGDANYTANFTALVEHHITYTPQQTHGTISVSPVNAYMGDIVTLTATPDPGFTLDYWDVNTVSKGNVPVDNNQFIMPDNEVTVSASFKVAEQNLTVYNGTATNQYIPMYGYYFDDYTKSECIIPASQLTEMVGGTISAITFYPSSVGTNSTTWGDAIQTVFLKEVESTTLGGSYSGTTGATIVKQALLDMPTAGTEYTIIFDSPYIYSGGNLLIGVYNTDDGAYNKVEWYGTGNLTSGVSAYGNNGSSLASATYNAQAFLPKTKFTYTPSTTPYLTLAPNSATVITGFTQTLTANYGNVSGTPTITYTSSNNSVATVSGTGATATVTGVSVGTATITATMTYESVDYTATCAVTVEEPQYCTPSFGSNNDCITNITLGDINNTTASASTNGYGDYTNLTTDLEPETTATLSLTSGGGSGTHAAAVWIDFDNSYTFESSERVGTQGSIGANATVTIGLAIPANATPGSHRMRVVYQYNVDATAIDPCASASYGEGEDYTVVITSPCPKPTGLALSGITAHGVTATWDAEVGDVFNYAIVSGAVTTVTTYDGSITATGTNCSMSWNNLSPETDYTVVIRKKCGNDDYSIAVAQSFTTEATCPVPSNVTASNLTINSAHISWGGNADSYNVKYATATITGTTLEQVFFDGFETGIGNWTTYAVAYTSDATNWKQYDATNFSSGSVTNHTGNYVAMSRSYDGSSDRSVDNWLVSPQMTLGDVVKFWVNGDNSGWQEYYAVYVSTGTNAISDFTMVEAPELAPSDGSWAERIVDLSAYAGQQGYIAIRHTDEGKDFLLIDDFGVYNTVNTYSYGTFTTLPPTSQNSCDITGLSPETSYVAQVQADCGSTDGTSSWSSVYFTTPDACSAPTDLVSSNITATTATLGWSDNQDSYNVRYRKVYFYEGFEGETLPSGWTTIDANSDGNTWSVGHATTHSGNNGAYNVSYVYGTSGTTPDDYLVSPQLDLQGSLRVWLSGFGDDHEEHFEILLSTTGNSAADFTTTLVGETITSNAYVEYTADLSSYAGQQGYIAIRHHNCTDQRYLYVDDFGLYGSENWVSVTPNPTDATVTLTGLQPNTGYEWQVQGLNCNTSGSSTDWSEVATFTTAYASFTLDITGYGTGDGNWYLIASPLPGSTPVTSVAGLTNNEFDLYRFNQANELEWENYKYPGDNYHFSLESGRGYLYANSSNVTLTFNGIPYSGNGKVTISNVAGYSFSGWNLIGNPWSTSATIGGRDFLRLNDDRDDLITAADPNIAAMEGIFVYTDETAETVTFSTGSKDLSTGERIVLNLSHNGGKIVDRAIVRFGKGSTLPKFQIKDNSTKLYLSQDNHDYAVARVNEQDEMPVNFKASENGNYTITVNVDNVTMNYLHLIDNLTGADIDLLQTPSYSFTAKTSDYTSRFRLVLKADDLNTDNDFAFIDADGNIIINGDGIIQIIDMLGRIAVERRDTLHCVSTTGMAPGVYMLRLIQGDSVKTQKIVIK